MSRLTYTECPSCGFYGAEDFEENNGERDITCDLCGHREDLSEVDMGYFDSKEEWKEYNDQVGENDYYPSQDVIDNVQEVVKFANWFFEEDEVLLETFDINAFIEFAVKEENIRDSGNFRRALVGYIDNHKENARNTIKEAMK